MHIWGKGRAAGRVGSDFLSAIACWVGPGQRFAGSGRAGSKKSDPWTTLGPAWARALYCIVVVDNQVERISLHSKHNHIRTSSISFYSLVVHNILNTDTISAVVLMQQCKTAKRHSRS